jgi:hypothetical protein
VVAKLVQHQHEIICKNVVVHPFARLGLQCKKSQMEPPLNNASKRNEAFNNGSINIMKRDTTSLVEHHKVYNHRSRYEQTILTYNKEYPWPCTIPLDETCTLEPKGLLALSKTLLV